MISFDETCAVVTGGSSGIGEAVVRLLTRAGAAVANLDLTTPNEGLHVPVDLSDPSAATRALHTAHERLGGLDILVNVAGIFSPNPLTTFSWEAYRQTMAVNLDAAVALMAAAAPLMPSSGGRIVNVTSVHADVSDPGALAYDASKAALAAATRTAALELADRGILVNSVAPGFVRTPMSIVNGQDELDSDDFRVQYVERGRIPLRRAAEPEEIAHVVLWLASATNTYVTGSCITADGGLTVGF